MNHRQILRNKKRIVIKIGSSSLTHEATGRLNFSKLESYIREISNLKNMGKDVILVSSGAIAVGVKALNLDKKPEKLETKQAVAAVGQAALMMIYQKLFREYNQIAAQVLLTKDLMDSNKKRTNAHNTLEALLEMGTIPIVNENDTVATEEIEFGDNDTLSALVATLIQADLLLLLSDINGLYECDPKVNPKAQLLTLVQKITPQIENMGGGSGTLVGTGGMITKITAAKIATNAGIDMIIANASEKNVIEKIIEGEKIGTLFLAH